MVHGLGTWRLALPCSSPFGCKRRRMDIITVLSLDHGFGGSITGDVYMSFILFFMKYLFIINCKVLNGC